MLFSQEPPLPLLVCATCLGVGKTGAWHCKTCLGLGVACTARGHLLFWNFPLTRYHLSLSKARRIFYKLRFVTVGLLFIALWGWALSLLYRSGWYQYPAVLLSPLKGAAGNLQSEILFLFWFGALLACYLFYRSIVEKRQEIPVEHYDYEHEDSGNITPELAGFNQTAAFRGRGRRNIAASYSAEATAVMERAFRLADREGAPLSPRHIMLSLLVFNRISNLFIRLGIPAATIQKQLSQPPASLQSSPNEVSQDVYQILFRAYEEAYSAHEVVVSATELLVATIKQSIGLQEIFFDLGVEEHKLINVVAWARIRERLRRQYEHFRHAARHRSTKGMDRAMTAVATPFLNQFSDDVTLLAQFGHTDACVARDKEINQIFQVVEGGQANVLLVGDYGVGKKSIIEGLAAKMVEDDVPARLKDKRMVRLSTSALLAGTSASGAVERLRSIMHEIARAGNIILFIHNLHELMGVSAGTGAQSLDVGGTLAEFLISGRFLTLATTSTEAYAQLFSNSQLSSVFTKVAVAEMDNDQAIQVLESKVGYVEYKHQVFFSYAAIEKAVELAHKFLHEVMLPGSALEIMSEAASFTRNKKGANALVSAEEVASVVAAKTKIPVNTVSSDETTKLMHLEETMHQRVIGQEEAVSLVANSLRRARAQIRATTKPIANFLFLGPTGVGKTELTKTIAEVYFGGEERMVRLDMSEYQDKASIYRLIGSPGAKGSGVLTEAIRRNPFSLLLLDEIEKADRDILNLFLQVMDDGRLSDSTGRVVDFTNVILIATSNAGTSYVSEQLKAGLSTDMIKDRLLHGQLKEYFRPEFLNRFDGIVLFKPLDQEAIKKIAGLMLKRVGKDLEQKAVQLEVTDEALTYFASIGFDPEFGARPMRRVVQDKVENALAELILGNKLKRGTTVVIGAEGKVSVK